MRPVHSAVHLSPDLSCSAMNLPCDLGLSEPSFEGLSLHLKMGIVVLNVPSHTQKQGVR